MSQELGFVEHLAGNRYFDRKFESEAVKVLPGEYFVTSTNVLMVMVPPPRIASRALRHRFMITCSIWLRSACTCLIFSPKCR